MAKLPLEYSLRDRIKRVRDGYSTGQKERMTLYMWLKSTDSWRVKSMREKVGGKAYDWLVGLEKYGDAHGWMQRIIAKELIRQRGGAAHE